MRKMQTCVIGLFLIVLSGSCASLQASGLPSLESRTLLIDVDRPGLYFQYSFCTSSILGICTKHEIRRELYDLTDPKVRQQLHDMNFVAKVLNKPV
jgi:hypothetical protein